MKASFDAISISRITLLRKMDWDDDFYEDDYYSFYPDWGRRERQSRSTEVHFYRPDGLMVTLKERTLVGAWITVSTRLKRVSGRAIGITNIILTTRRKRRKRKQRKREFHHKRRSKRLARNGRKAVKQSFLTRFTTEPFIPTIPCMMTLEKS